MRFQDSKSSGIWCRVECRIFTDVSEEFYASTIRVKAVKKSSGIHESRPLDSNAFLSVVAMYRILPIQQKCTNSGRQLAQATTFCTEN